MRRRLAPLAIAAALTTSHVAAQTAISNLPPALSLSGNEKLLIDQPPLPGVLGNTVSKSMSLSQLAAFLSSNISVAIGPLLQVNGAGQFASPVTGTLTTTAGSVNATLVGATGAVLPGDQIVANPNVQDTTIVSSAFGSNVVLSLPAAGSGSKPAQFGVQRQSLTSTMLANTLGAANIDAGGAAGGRSTWLNQLFSASDYPSAAPLMALSVSGGAGAVSWTGSRSSDAGQRPIPANTDVMWTDYIPPGLQTPWSTWSRYIEGDLTSSTPGYHINVENSIYSRWDYVPTDPYGFNPIGGTRNERLDCGKGAPFEHSGPPQKCSAALEIVDNDAIYGKGIVFGLDALDTSEHGLGQAIVMAPFQALVWYYANGTPGWSIYQDAMSTAGGAQFQLHLSNGFADFGNAEVHANGSLISTGFGSSPNSLVMSGGATGNLAGIGTVNGPLAIAAAGSNTTYLGSPTSATQVQGPLGVGGSASVGADLAVIGHIYGSSPPPTVSGGTLSAGATDTNGTITFAAAGTAVLKFVKGHTLKPDCVVWSADGPQPNGGTTAGPAGTAGLTIVSPTAEMVSYICFGG